MQSCFNVDHILDTVLEKLPLRNIISAQAVCHRFKERCVFVLRRHRSLVLYSRKKFKRIKRSKSRASFSSASDFRKHHIFPDSAIGFAFHDINSWRSAFNILPGIQFLSCRSRPDKNEIIHYENLFKLILEEYGHQLQCLSVPSFEEKANLSLINGLPELSELYLESCSVTGIKQILTKCPKLQILSCCSEFTEWTVLPKGFKKLHRRTWGPQFRGFENILASPAAETIEEITEMILTADSFQKDINLPFLQVLDVHIPLNPNECLKNLARVIKYSPVIRLLAIGLECGEEIDSSSWVRLIEECSRLTDFSITRTFRSFQSACLFQEVLVESISINMRNLKKLCLEFPVSSTGLKALESLEDLESFKMHLGNSSKQIDVLLFDEETLLSFVTTHFEKKMRHFQIHISAQRQMLLPVSENFQPRLTQLAKIHSFRIQYFEKYWAIKPHDKMRIANWNGLHIDKMTDD